MRTIKTSEVKTLPRGRTATFDQELLNSLKQIKAGTSGVLDDEFGKVTDKVRRAAVSATVRNHWRHLHGPDASVKIQFSPEGFAQVTAK